MVFILIIMLVFFLSIFIKKKVPLFLVTIALIIGVVLIFEQVKHTTFTELYSIQMNEDRILESATITVNELVDDYPSTKIQTTIKDEEILDQIISGLSELELKKDLNSDKSFWEYEIKFVSTKKIKENMYQSEYVYVNLSDQYLNDYEIVNDTNLLNTINTIVENK